MPSLISYLKYLQNSQVPINVVYDIGACRGNWAHNVHKLALPNSKFYLFEANPTYIDDLKYLGFPFFQAVLSRPGKGTVDFYNGGNTGDSYYKESSKHYENQSSIRLPTFTLDQIIKEYKLPIPDLIKLDTQGSELDILIGAQSILNSVKLIYTELPILSYNSGAPNIQEYIDFFKQNNFIPVNLLECHIFENTLFQVDVMFMRKDEKAKYLGPNNTFKI